VATIAAFCCLISHAHAGAPASAPMRKLDSDPKSSSDSSSSGNSGSSGMTWQTKAAIAGGAVLGVAAAGTAAGVLAMQPKHKHKVAIKKPPILAEVVYEEVTPAPKKWTSMNTHMLYADEENGKVASQLYEDSDRPTRAAGLGQLSQGSTLTVATCALFGVMFLSLSAIVHAGRRQQDPYVSVEPAE